MNDVRFYLSRFLRRIHWFLIVATVISAVAITVAMSLPPAYVSELRLLVEGQQIPDELAEATASTPAPELLQIMEQRLMTRSNLLDIARAQRVFPDQAEMSPDEIVQAMRAHTRIRSRSGRQQATLMTITFEAYRPNIAAGVLNAYLSLILEQESRLRTGRAETTQDFFEQQVAELEGSLDLKNAEILSFKTENADALPEILDFYMSQRADLQSRVSELDASIGRLENQREQLLRIYETTGQVQSQTGSRTPQEERLQLLQAELSDALSIYSEQSPRIRQLRARIAQAEAAVAAAAPGEAADGETPVTDPREAALQIQLADIANQVDLLEQEKAAAEVRVAELSASIARIPANTIRLEALERDRNNIQAEYNQAVSRLSRASTGERIEVMSRGQRFVVIEPPAVPNKPTKPDRLKLSAAGSALGVAAGLGLVFLLEFLNRSPCRPEDIVARFQVMPIATIPYVRSRRQMIVERGLKLTLLLVILVGVPVAIYAVHLYYLPLDLLADKVMNKLGVRL